MGSWLSQEKWSFVVSFTKIMKIHTVTVLKDAPANQPTSKQPAWTRGKNNLFGKGSILRFDISVDNMIS